MWCAMAVLGADSRNEAKGIASPRTCVYSRHIYNPKMTRLIRIIIGTILIFLYIIDIIIMMMMTNNL